MANFRRLGIPILSLAAMTWIVFGSSITATFVGWDDTAMVVINPGLNPPTWRNVGGFWRRPYLGLYTPLAYTAWAAVAAIEHPPLGKDLQASKFHLLNLSFHAAAAIFVFLLLKELLPNPLAAWWGAVFFLIHPFQAQPVGWVAGMNNLLCGALAIAAMWQYVLYAKSKPPARWHYALATVLYVLALFSKPTAVVVPLMVAAIDYGLLRRSLTTVGKAISLWILMALSFAIAARISQPAAPDWSVPVWTRPLIAIDALGFYAARLIVPVKLAMDYERTPQWVLNNPAATWPGFALLFVMFCTWLRGHRSPMVWTGIALAVMGLLPVLGFASFDFQDYSTEADRYMYLPLVGIALLVGVIMTHAKKLIPSALAAAAIASLAVCCFRQVEVWHDPESLAAQQFEFDSNNPLAHNVLGAWLIAHGQDDAAEMHMRAAIAGYNHVIQRPDGAVWLALGNLLWRQHHAAEAIEQYKLAIPRLPLRQQADGYDNLGMALYLCGDTLGAREQFQNALKLQPDDAIARKNLERVAKSPQ